MGVILPGQRGDLRVGLFGSPGCRFMSQAGGAEPIFCSLGKNLRKDVLAKEGLA